MNKSRMFALLLLTVMLALMVGCSVPAEKVVIEYYGEYNGFIPRGEAVQGVEAEGDWGKRVEAMYEAINPNVDIVPSVAVYGGGGSEQLSTRVAAGRYPHVYQAFSGRLFSYAPLFLELPDPSGLQFEPVAVDDMRVNGKLVAYPIEFWEKHTVINMTVVEAAGCAGVAPTGTQWTTAEASELAACLREFDPDLLLFVPPGFKASGQHDYWGMFSGGARMFTDGDYTNCTLDVGGYAARHLEWQRELLTDPETGKLYINPADYDVMEWFNRFTTGRAAIGFKPWVSYLKTNYADGKAGDIEPNTRYLALPHLPGVAASPVQQAANNGVAVFAPAVEGNERLTREAMKFALWLTSPGASGNNPDYNGPDYARHYYGYQSARSDGWQEDIDPAVLEDIRLYGSYNPGFASGAFNESRVIWGEEVTKFWLGEATAAEVVERFAERYNEAIQRVK